MILPESRRPLRTAIDVARNFDASLATVSILGDPPVYTSFAILSNPLPLRTAAFIPSCLRSCRMTLARLMLMTDITFGGEQALAIGLEKAFTAFANLRDRRIRILIHL